MRTYYRRIVSRAVAVTTYHLIREILLISVPSHFDPVLCCVCFTKADNFYMERFIVMIILFLFFLSLFLPSFHFIFSIASSPPGRWSLKQELIITYCNENAADGFTKLPNRDGFDRFLTLSRMK